MLVLRIILSNVSYGALVMLNILLLITVGLEVGSAPSLYLELLLQSAVRLLLRKLRNGLLGSSMSESFMCMLFE